ncbi:uncharacterized protein APUU_30765A [Aspergillus puulaauensis]|uniref:Cytochrome P450 n=1 Tax=Aspergillus puulaauensis TaxID=1220207 RepID=A0A7R8AMC2_9EURO|nr:uncharacterized protein APUU_30765A [Aspergillus puulaauensis]BCS22540.1 hypothetical protein APUU_30765A [Aspergillus puulaauensis]
MKLPYLTACCKEAMRMIPSVGLTLPRIVPRGGRYIAGQWFDGGVRVGVNAAVIHFNKEVFGDDAEEFNPERWFRANASRMDRYMFQFGGGSRTCIGKNISLCEIHKLVPEVLRLYRFEMVDPAEELKTMNRWFNKPRHLDVVVKNRSADM